MRIPEPSQAYPDHRLGIICCGTGRSATFGTFGSPYVKRAKLVWPAVGPARAEVLGGYRLADDTFEGARRELAVHDNKEPGPDQAKKGKHDDE